MEVGFESEIARDIVLDVVVAQLVEALLVQKLFFERDGVLIWAK